MKRLLRIAFLLILLALIVAAAGSFVQSFYRDIDAPTDSDLRTPPTDFSAGENGFAAAILNDSIPAAREQGNQEIRRRVESGRWRSRETAEFVARNRGIYERFRASLDRPGFEATHSPDGRATIYRWGDFRTTVAMHAFELVDRGDTDAALMEAARLIEFGTRAGRAENSVWLIMHGQLDRRAGRELLLEILAARRPSTDALKACLDILGRCDLDPNEAMVRLCRREYTRFAEAVDLYREAPTTPISFAPNGGASGADIEDLFGQPLFRPHRVQAELANYYRDQIRRIRGQRLGRTVSRSARWSSWTPVGYYANLLAMDVRNLAPGWKEDSAHHELLLAAIGCWILDDTQGRTPDSLDELRAVGVESTLSDPFDGGSLRYRPGEAVLYSVGNDITDSRGSSALDWRAAWADEQEPTLRLHLRHR